MGSKVPGAVMTEPPTAKLPCSWIISGPVLPFLVCCALAEAKRKAGISQSAMKDFRRLLLILNHTPAALSAAKHSVITEGNPSDANAGRVVNRIPDRGEHRFQRCLHRPRMEANQDDFGFGSPFTRTISMRSGMSAWRRVGCENQSRLVTFSV